jgi:PAS domain S-box-containing protein
MVKDRNLTGKIPERNSKPYRRAMNAKILEYGEIFGKIPAGIFVLEANADGGFIFAGANEMFESLTGVPVQAVRGKTSEELSSHFSVYTLNEIGENIRRCVADQQCISYNGRILTNDKSLICKILLCPVVSPLGAVKQVIGSATDISDLRRDITELDKRILELQKRLKTAAEEFATINRNLELAEEVTSTGLWHFDPHANLFKTSKSLDRILEMPFSNGVPISSFCKLIDPSNIARFDRTINKIFAGMRDDLKIELRVNLSGKHKHIEMLFKPVYTGSRCDYVYGAIHDITIRKDMEDALTMAQFAVDESLDEIYFLDKTGRFNYANQTALRNFGITADKLSGRYIYEFNAEIDAKSWHELAEKINAETRICMVSKHIDRNGNKYPVEIKGILVRTGDEQCYCFYGRDISEEHRLKSILKANGIDSDTPEN